MRWLRLAGMGVGGNGGVASCGGRSIITNPQLILEIITEDSMDIWEERRKAPLHYWAKANNAWFCAGVLENTLKEQAQSIADKIGYANSVEIAMHEGFLRESSIALELILKALHCAQSDKKPPKTHDVLQLWQSSRD